jgi:hypothetical protein
MKTPQASLMRPVRFPCSTGRETDAIEPRVPALARHEVLLLADPGGLEQSSAQGIVRMLASLVSFGTTVLMTVRLLAFGHRNGHRRCSRKGDGAGRWGKEEDCFVPGEGYWEGLRDASGSVPQSELKSQGYDRRGSRDL